MEYRALGRSSLKVSRLWLGGMSLGSPKQRPWVADAQESRRIIAAALEVGINTIDTADAYGAGESESLIGATLADMGLRDEIVLATKFGLPLGSKDPNRTGYSRRNIIQRCDSALRRLGTDRIDLLQTHIWRGDSSVEEAAEAFEHLIRQGKVIYAGITDMPAWQAAKWIFHCKYNGLSPLISLQHHYNPLWREDEREMIPLCLSEGVGVVAYSPMARGFLAGTGRGTSRETTDDMMTRFYARDADSHLREILTGLAGKAGLSPVQLSLKWVLDRPHVTAAVVGPTSAAQLPDLVAAAAAPPLDAALAGRIADAYAPRTESGHG